MLAPSLWRGSSIIKIRSLRYLPTGLKLKTFVTLRMLPELVGDVLVLVRISRGKVRA
jgi:hypothetical protein